MARPLVRLGSTGPDVLEARLRLNLAGASPQLPATDEFDQAMDDATRAFQAAYGLGVDGDIGTGTWTALDQLAGARLLSAADLDGVQRTREAARELLRAGDYVTAKTLLDAEYARPELPPESRSGVHALLPRP